MKVALKSQNIFILPITGLLFFSLFSITFFLIYALYDYQIYLRSFQTSQAQEVKTVQGKVENVLNSLKKLLVLTQSRIQSLQATSHNSPQNVQSILSTLHPLQRSFNLPDLQQAAYIKLSSPRWMINRFDTYPIDSDKYWEEERFIKPHLPTIEQKNNTIVARIGAFNPIGKVEGIIELKIGLPEFKDFIDSNQKPELKLISLLPAAFDFPNLLSEQPFAVYGKQPDTFSIYFLAGVTSSKIIFLYAFLFILLLVYFLRHIEIKFTKKHQKTFISLKQSLHQAEETRQVLKADIFLLQHSAEAHLLSCQAQHKFYNHLYQRQMEDARHIALALNNLESSSKENKKIELMQCRDQAMALSEGFWIKRNNETIIFKDVIENIMSYFSEKIFKSRITIELNISSQISMQGDSLLLDLLLLNSIGKSLYRVPDQGTVSVSLNESARFRLLKIQDNGFGIELAEKLIIQSCDFLMPSEKFNQLCQNNGILCKFTKSPNGLNTTNLIIPIHEEKEPCNNVVQLFP